MSETKLRATVHTGGLGSPSCSCAGLLVGPDGQIWDLYPRLGYGPRLLAYAAEGLMIAADGESASGPPHPATPPWIPGIVGQPAHVSVLLNHSSHYLALSTVQVVDGLLVLGAAALYSIKNPRLLIHTRDGQLQIDERDSQAVATLVTALVDGQWRLGGPSSPYLLIAPRNSDGQELLDFAGGFALPGAAGGLKAPWDRQSQVGPRHRLSGLAAQRRLPGRLLSNPAQITVPAC